MEEIAQLQCSPKNHDGCLENLRFSIELYWNETNLEEVVARMRDLTIGARGLRSGYHQWPLKLVMLCQAGRSVNRCPANVADVPSDASGYPKNRKSSATS